VQSKSRCRPAVPRAPGASSARTHGWRLLVRVGERQLVTDAVIDIAPVLKPVGFDARATSLPVGQPHGIHRTRAVGWSAAQMPPLQEMERDCLARDHARSGHVSNDGFQHRPHQWRAAAAQPPATPPTARKCRLCLSSRSVTSRGRRPVCGPGLGAVSGSDIHGQQASR